jgi:hypothetical protein
MTISVRPSLITFWLRSQLTLTETMVNGSAPNTLFGIIPAGRNDISQPLNRISRVQVSTKFVTGALLLGAIFVAFAVSTGSAVWWVFAVVALVSSYRAELLITDSGGGTQEVSVSPLDREAVQGFASAVNQKLALT